MPPVPKPGPQPVVIPKPVPKPGPQPVQPPAPAPQPKPQPIVPPKPVPPVAPAPKPQPKPYVPPAPHPDRNEPHRNPQRAPAPVPKPMPQPPVAPAPAPRPAPQPKPAPIYVPPAPHPDRNEPHRRGERGPVPGAVDLPEDIGPGPKPLPSLPENRDQLSFATEVQGLIKKHGIKIEYDTKNPDFDYQDMRKYLVDIDAAFTKVRSKIDAGLAGKLAIVLTPAHTFELDGLKAGLSSKDRAEIHITYDDGVDDIVDDIEDAIDWYKELYPAPKLKPAPTAPEKPKEALRFENGKLTLRLDGKEAPYTLEAPAGKKLSYRAVEKNIAGVGKAQQVFEVSTPDGKVALSLYVNAKGKLASVEPFPVYTFQLNQSTKKITFIENKER